MKTFFDNIAYELTNNLVVSILDVVLTAFIIYGLVVLMKKNNAVKLIKYLTALVILGVILSGEILGFTLLSKIFSLSLVCVVVIVVVMFPQEIRRGLLKLSSPKEMQEVFTTQYDCSDDDLRKTIADIVRAVQNMSKKDVGALIVIAPNVIPSSILESGTKLDAELSGQLLECLFNTKAPLHDGAVFIRGNKILAAGCFLPLTQNAEIDKELGTRHRAAIGVTESYNVVTIIVSEETGVISVAKEGKISRYFDSVMLTDTLEQIYGLKVAETAVKKRRKK